MMDDIKHTTPANTQRNANECLGESQPQWMQNLEPLWLFEAVEQLARQTHVLLQAIGE